LHGNIETKHLFSEDLENMSQYMRGGPIENPDPQGHALPIHLNILSKLGLNRILQASEGDLSVSYRHQGRLKRESENSNTN
jgi:hypothetical protein